MMTKKNVLFIGVTKFNLDKDLHLKKKYEGLSSGIKPYILAKGKLSRRKIWDSEFYLLPSALFWPLAFLAATWLCLAKKIDTIVAQSPLSEGFLGTVFKITLKKELIIEIHGDWKEGPFLSRKRKFGFIEKRIVPFLAKISFLAADKIRAVSANLAEEAKKTAPKKQYFLLSTFTDLDDFFNEKDIRFDNFILFVGRAQKVKGAEYLIEAFSLIKKDFPDFKLVLVGEGLPEGKLPLEEVRRKMRDCYCLVVPSLSEGLPRVIMEAQALGKPVIASRVGGIPELIEDGKTGFLFEAGNKDELAEKLRILLSKKQLAVEIGGKGREAAQKRFSNQRYIENYLKIIYS